MKYLICAGILVLLLVAVWWAGYWASGYFYRKAAWRRGLYDQPKIHSDDDNPPGSL